MKNRFKESIGPILTTNLKKDAPTIFLSPSDRGVRRNLGRNGSRFAPRAIINVFAKLQNHSKDKVINHLEVTNQKIEDSDFEKSQSAQSKKIKETYELCSPAKIVHLGGGHDHIYPLLAGVQSFFEKIIILNFDAHCDTRNEPIAHSGNPFRNFDSICQVETHLLQIGIHLYANSISTLSPLKNIAQTLIYKDNKTDQYLFEKVKEFLDKLIGKEKTLVVISLDCDGIAAGEMEAVSAVNHNGFSSVLIRDTLEYLNQLSSDIDTAFGIYEYNPLFDNLSQKGSRLCAGLIYDYLFDGQK